MRRQSYKSVAIIVVLFAGFLLEPQTDAAPVTLSFIQQAESKETQPDSLQPSPDLSPAQVVRIQIEALGHNDTPYENAGIEITFRFASPANKVATGPLDRFIGLINNPMYRPMLNHREAQYGELRVEEKQATQPVILTAQNGERAGYVFFLSKQESGPYEACWMTDSVIRFEVQQEQEKPLPTI